MGWLRQDDEDLHQEEPFLELLAHQGYDDGDDGQAREIDQR